MDDKRINCDWETLSFKGKVLILQFPPTNIMRRDIAMERLRETYKVFSIYPRFDRPRPCTHCISEETQFVMMDIPLQTFPDHHLSSLIFNFNCYTWGELRDIKHFIPRMIELIFESDTQLKDFSLLLERGKWQEWPIAEQQIIESCITEIWNRHWLSSNDLWDVFGEANYDCLEGLLTSHGHSQRLAELVFKREILGAAKLALLIKKMDTCKYWPKQAIKAFQLWIISGEPYQIMAQITDEDFQDLFMPTKEEVEQAISFLHTKLSQ